jgi:hypothetical protein
MKKFFALLALLAPLPAPAFDSPFGVAPLADSELAELRGGFIAPGGLIIDFALTSQAIVNGDVLNEVSLNSDQLNSLQNLRQVIQVGPGNEFKDDLTGALNNPSLVTIIQNSLDGTVIQTTNVIDVTVQNYTQYQNNLPLSNILAATPQL